MGVYGIIAARTNNKTAVAGIAPNTTQVVMLRPSYSSATYVSALRWAAGLEVTPDKELGWPDPIDSPAAIICCSHGSGEDLTDYMDRSLTEMATQGRGNLGTLVIYSVGDGDPGTIFTGFRQWAAHPHTMAVANTQAASGDTPERKTPESNYGPALDICAQGQGSRSLGVSNVTRSFGKTSAAAAHVAGVAALVCSVDPNCPAETVRHILTMTATKIDVGGGTWTAKNGRDFSCWYGYGRLDAHAAVKAAIAASRVSV
jgi:subtilisin family serine protease